MNDVMEFIAAVLLIGIVLAVFAFGGVLFIGTLCIVFVLAVIGDIIQYITAGLSSLFSRSGTTREDGGG